jgi:hypothetical protein
MEERDADFGRGNDLFDTEHTAVGENLHSSDSDFLTAGIDA